MKLNNLTIIFMLATSIYAIENVKINGDAKLFYVTEHESATGAPDMFDKDATYVDSSLHLGLTADLSEGVSSGLSVTAVSTLGLENNVGTYSWSSAHSAIGEGDDPSYDDAMWIDELWLSTTAFDTTAKMGRQALDTPFIHSETWGVDSNTFEGIFFLNQSIKDTTIAALWIGKSNGSADDPENSVNLEELAIGGYVSEDGKFNTFGSNGAYVLGLVNNSYKPLKAQAWYYNLQSLTDAYWVQTDFNFDGFLLGAQYASIDPDTAGLSEHLNETLLSTNETNAYALMVGYEQKDSFNVKLAYSEVSDDGTMLIANIATGNQQSMKAESKLYTEVWWDYGIVGTPGAKSFSLSSELSASYDIDIFMACYYVEVEPDSLNESVRYKGKQDVLEFALSVAKSFGPLDTSIVASYDDIQDKDYNSLDPSDVDSSVYLTTIQIYLTYNF